MLTSIGQFREDIRRVRAIGRLYGSLGQAKPAALDETDLLRTQFVMAVSALDRYIHEITCVGMLEVFDGKRPPTDSFQRFEVSVVAAKAGLAGAGGNLWFEAEIRAKHGHLTFQQPDKIAEAVRLFSSCSLWPSVAAQLGLSTQFLRSRLGIIVDRRNKIAHESDLDPSVPGARWPITLADSENATSFIQDICEAIHNVV